MPRSKKTSMQKKSLWSKPLGEPGKLDEAMRGIQKKLFEVEKTLWPGEIDASDLRKSLYKDTLKPMMVSSEGIIGTEISGEWVDEMSSGKLSFDDYIRTGEYLKKRAKEAGIPSGESGGYLVPDDVAKDMMERAKKGEDISKWFETPETAMKRLEGIKPSEIYGYPITYHEYGRSAIEIDHEYTDGFIGLNPENPDLKFRLDRLMSNAEWVGYHYLAGNWDMWAAYLGDGYWVTSVKFYRSDTFIRPWYVIFWHDHDEVFTWLHTELLNGAIIYSDDTENMHWDQEFVIVRKIEKWAQSFARRFADGELSEEWSGHED